MQIIILIIIVLCKQSFGKVNRNHNKKKRELFITIFDRYVKPRDYASSPVVSQKRVGGLLIPLVTSVSQRCSGTAVLKAAPRAMDKAHRTMLTLLACSCSKIPDN
uniref:Putative secreted protein n=1 Tax=Anopheles darlingi TaxID=43151 RepID=A0A2M4D359_ANODA